MTLANMENCAVSYVLHTDKGDINVESPTFEIKEGAKLLAITQSIVEYGAKGVVAHRVTQIWPTFEVVKPAKITGLP